MSSVLLSTVLSVGVVLVVRLEVAAATCKLLGFGGVPLEVGAILPSPQNSIGPVWPVYMNDANRNKSSNNFERPKAQLNTNAKVSVLV